MGEWQLCKDGLSSRVAVECCCPLLPDSASRAVAAAAT